MTIHLAGNSTKAAKLPTPQAHFDTAPVRISSRLLFLWVPDGDSNAPFGLKDDTHFSPDGAATMIGAAFAGLRALRRHVFRWLAGPLQ